MIRGLLLRGAATFVAIAAALPLVWLVVRASGAGGQDLLALALAPRTRTLLATTAIVTFATLVLASALAIPLAWLVTRTDLPGRRLIAVLAALPLVIPSYIGAFALVALLGPRGAFQNVLEPFGIERLPQIVYGVPGAILVLGLLSYPYLYLPLVGGLSTLDPALEENARLLGAGKHRRLRTILLPQLVRPFASGCLLVALYALSDFGAVSITRVATLTVSIDNAWRSLLERSEAAGLGLILVAFGVVLIALETWLVRGAPAASVRPRRQAPLHALGPTRWWIFSAVVAVLGFALIAPLAAIGWWALRGLSAGIDLELTLAPALTSLGLATAAAVLAVLAAWPVAWWSARVGSPASRLVERAVWIGHALPGLVLALGLVFFAIRLAHPLYQTTLLLVVAYMLRFLPEALGPQRAALARVPARLEEAARALGRSPAAAARTVLVPLALPGVLAGAALVALTTLKELPATLVLRPTGVETLATRIWSAAADGRWAEAAVPALLLVALAAPITWMVSLRFLADHDPTGKPPWTP